MISRLGKVFARHRRNPFVRRLARAAYDLHRGYENLDYDWSCNGEAMILERLGRLGGKVVFDAGANTGDWSALCLQYFRDPVVHAFEIVPGTFAKLEERFAGAEDVILNNLGLSNREGQIDVYFDEERSTIATSIPGFSESFHSYSPGVASLPVTTGDQYCQANDICHIDLLKIDVEGHEPEVLQGFQRLLSVEAIDVIQFEYGYINIDTGFLLRDFYKILEQYGMVIGKLYPKHVEFREYRHQHENFIGPNYIAVRKARKDVIESLQA